MRKEQFFSVFALTRCEKVTLKGAKWELKNEKLEMSTKGLHNKGNDKEIMIETDGIIALIIEK